MKKFIDFITGCKNCVKIKQNYSFLSLGTFVGKNTTENSHAADCCMVGKQLVDENSLFS